MKRRQTRVRLERERVQKTRERQLSLRLSPGGFVFIGVSRRRPAQNLRLATHCVHRRAVVQRAEPHRTGDGERRRLRARARRGAPSARRAIRPEAFVRAHDARVAAPRALPYPPDFIVVFRAK
eukprot:30892-Pelagococcus_subviridis.AAC.3